MSPQAKGHPQCALPTLRALCLSGHGWGACSGADRVGRTDHGRGDQPWVCAGVTQQVGKPPRAEFPPGNKPGPRAAWQGLGCPVGRGGGWKPGGPCPGPSACLSHRGVGSSRSQDNAQGLQARSAQGGSSGGHEHKEAWKGKTATASTATASAQPKATAKLLTHCGQPANARKPSTAGRGGRTQRGAGKSNQGEEE